MKQIFDDTKLTWGGKRTGAGRPSSGRSKKNIYVTDYEFELLKKLLEVYRQGGQSKYSIEDAQKAADLIIAKKNEAFLK